MTETRTKSTPPPRDRRPRQLRSPWLGRVAAALLAALTLTAALAGVAGAQQADPCQSQANRVADLEAQNQAFVRFMLENAKRDLRDCRARAHETRQTTLASERSRAGQAYADARSTDRRYQAAREARDAWREADQAFRGLERDADNYTPGPAPTQPYNDGLSDWERYWCVQRDTTPVTDVNGDRISGKNLQGTCFQ